MKCPYYNPQIASKCDLVQDPEGVAGFMVREFCYSEDCLMCPVFNTLMNEKLENLKKEADAKKKTWTQVPLQSNTESQQRSENSS